MTKKLRVLFYFLIFWNLKHLKKRKINIDLNIVNKNTKLKIKK